MPDLTIIIPHRGPCIGLWATIQSCEDDLRHGSVSANYVVVSNGDPTTPELRETLSILDGAGRLLKHVHSDEALTPPVARQMGAQVADGRILAFFDNHCLVARQYFERAVLNFDNDAVGSLKSSVVFSPGGPTNYHYRLKLAFNFWADYAMIPAKPHKAYLIAAAGHGGFLIRKSVWDDIGGYGPNHLLDGYGGEEMLLDLKLWMYGHQNFIDPKLIHYHYAGKRGYSRHYTDDYYRNMMVAAHVIGGETWLNRVYDSFANGKHPRVNPKHNIYDLLVDAYERSKSYAQEVAQRRTTSLDDLLTWFRVNQVSM